MADPVSVLVVDDERPLVAVITTHLEQEGFVVLAAFDAVSALEIARTDRPDVIILDIALPDADGIDVCLELREFTDAYVIVLTARDDEADKVAALTAGADDYVLKPFSARELIARIGAMQRRPRDPRVDAERPVALSDIRIELGPRVVRLGGLAVELTRTEYDLLVALASRPGRALTRRQLLDEVWGADWFGDEQVVDVHVGHLRRKLGDPASHPRYIRTVRGVGYAAVTPASRP
jgi:DNA-binding response OmpR family regulator